MTDKSARDEIARHYGAHEIGGSLDDMYEFERERCYDFADRLIAALNAAGLAVVPRDLGPLAAIPEDDDAGLPTAEDVRGILGSAQHEGSQVMHTVSTPTTTINFNSDLSGAVLISRDGTCIEVDGCALRALFRAYLGARELKAVPRYPTEKMMEAASEPKNSDWNEIWHPMWDAAERLPAEATSLSNQRDHAPLGLTITFDIPLGGGK